MTDPTDPFATKFSARASEIRRGFPAPLQLALIDVVDAIAGDPEGASRRADPIEGDVFIYSHPDPPLQVTYKLDRQRRLVHVLHVAPLALQARHVLFVCYAREDDEYREELLKYLAPLQEGGRVRRIWDDQAILAGVQWKQEIVAAIGDSTAAILLVSQDFFNSNFVKEEELPRLLDGVKQRDLRLLWIAVKASTWRDNQALQERQALNNPDRPLETLEGPAQRQEFVRIYEKVKQALAAP
jgi:hypothetical protein